MPSNSRIVHFGVSQDLVHIPSHRDWKISNYFLLLNDLSQQSEHYANSGLISEHVSSCANAYAALNLLKFIKKRYESEFRSRLQIRIIVSDYSWGSINAICQALNVESIDRYAQHMFSLGNGLAEIDADRTYIVSSATRTMLCFLIAIHNALPNLDDFGAMKTFLCFSFSLLMDCTDMDSLSCLYRRMLFVFLSKTKSNSYREAFTQLNSQIRQQVLTKSNIVTVSIYISYWLFLRKSHVNKIYFTNDR